MGWAYCTNAQGRDVGYGVEALCDEPSCEEKIDRGLYYVCGDMHDGGEHGCGGYFCTAHLGFVLGGDGMELASPQLCDACSELFDPAATPKENEVHQ